MGVASGNLLMILASFSSLRPGRGFVVGTFSLELTEGPLFPLLMTAKASDTRSREAEGRERSSSRESSRQMVSWAGVELELAEATIDVLELVQGPPPEATTDAGALGSFLGLHSFSIVGKERTGRVFTITSLTLGFDAGITFFFAGAEVR